MSNVCWFLHKWSKWKYQKSNWETTRKSDGIVTGYFIRTSRSRTCDKCGEIQKEDIEDILCTKETYDNFTDKNKK